MSDGGQVHPEDDAWVVSVHASEEAEGALGSGVVIDDHRILTCAHVVGLKDTDGLWTESRPQVWAAFPKVSDRRLPVDRVVFPVAGARYADLAILYLPEPVPTGVTAALLRCPKPGDLLGKRWWAFGFPDGYPFGGDAYGHVGATQAYGRIRLDKDSRYPVRSGFSGGGLWSPDYQAVVGVVSQARDDNGDGQAITLHQADGWFPDEKIRALAGRWPVTAAGEVALSAWGWSLSADVEGTRHWRPRARGVSVDSERGYRFRGRIAALEAIRDWLDRQEPDRRVLVVTGSPGAGKSAVLGRIVTTSDPETARQLPSSDPGVRASGESVACAVHAKGKTALEVAVEIARAASAEIPEQIEDFAPALRDALSEQGRRFNVVIDALDEAASPAQARAIIGKVIRLAAETCADVGAQVVVGSRRADAGGDLLGMLGGAARVVNLDTAEFFAESDLAAYALATLQLSGDERPGNPYDDDAVAGPVAARIAELSAGNFLVAGLTARSHGMYDTAPADPAALSFSATVDDALREYLDRVPPPAGAAAPGVTAEHLLTALAFAEAPGLPAGLWRAALRALGVGDVPENTLIRFARSSAASFLVESSGDGGQETTVRLFHHALSDALLRTRAREAERPGDEQALTRAFLQVGRYGGWEHASAYLLRSLPAHAARAGLAGELLADDAYLLYADLRRLLQAAGGTLAPAGRDRVRLLRLTPQALDASPAGRAAVLSITEVLENLGNTYCNDRWQAPCRALWAVAAPRGEQVTCQGHRGEVWAVCVVEVEGRSLLATGSKDGTVQVWDPRTGERIGVLEGHQAEVNAVCTVEVDGRPLLASGSDDRTVRLWDPHTGKQVQILEGHQDWVNAVCTVEVDGQPLLATGSDDRTVRLWDPRTGEQVRVLKGHQDWVNAVCTVERLLAVGVDDYTVRVWDPGTGNHVQVLIGHQDWISAVCAVEVDGRPLLATGSNDETVRLWDPHTGKQVQILEGHQGGVNAVCAVEAEGRFLLATGSEDATVRLWDLSDMERADTRTGHRGGVNTVCTVEVEDRVLLATGSDDRTVRLWDPHTGEQVRVLEGHRDGVNSACVLEAEGRVLLATGSDDRTVRLWDPHTGTWVGALEGHRDWVNEGHRDGVNAVCTVEVDGRPLLATGSKDTTVRLRDPRTGTWVGVLRGHRGGVNAVCTVEVDGRPLLATGSDDETVRLWDPRTGKQVRVLKGHQDWVNAVCTVEVDGQPLLATGSNDETVRLWDPHTGKQVQILEGHQGGVNAVCVVEVDGQPLLATGSNDRTVRLWDPCTSTCLATVPTQHQALAITAISGSLAVGLDSGILMIKPSNVTGTS